MNYSTIGTPMETGPQVRPADLRGLFHELNNQLSVILAHAELIEAKALSEADRTRATQVVTSVLEAMTVTRSIRDHAGA